jgi:c-di-GMP-binding flagellar brake protein YcgR
MLGGGGLLLEVFRQLLPDTELKVRFRPAPQHPVVEATARVRYFLPGEGTGVEFTEISPEDRQIILEVIFQRMSYRRRHPRKKFVTQIGYEDGTFLGSSRDISAGGMFIETKQPFPEGAVFDFQFQLDDGGPLIQVEAAVRYAIRNLCMGIEFVNLTPMDRKRIEAYVAKSDSGG